MLGTCNDGTCGFTVHNVHNQVAFTMNWRGPRIGNDSYNIIKPAIVFHANDLVMPRENNKVNEQLQ